jgi:hypothetical protein
MASASANCLRTGNRRAGSKVNVTDRCQGTRVSNSVHAAMTRGLEAVWPG